MTAQVIADGTSVYGGLAIIKTAKQSTYIHVHTVQDRKRRPASNISDDREEEKAVWELFSCNHSKPLTRAHTHPLPTLLRYENNIIIDKQSLILQCSKPRVISSSATAPISLSASVWLVSAISQLTMSSPSLLTPGTVCQVTV